MAYVNKKLEGSDQYYPIQEPAIGKAFNADVYHQNKTLPKLFQPFTIKGIEFKNRVFAAPMCMYSSDNGHATDWHLVHIGGFASRGLGGIVMEATAVVPEGRISPEDAGLWTDSQIAPLKRITNFARAHGTPIGIQLGHAGRKASTYAPWVHSDFAGTYKADSWVASENENGWPNKVYAPSEIQFSPNYPKPIAMTEADMQYVEEAFVAAADRAEKAGFDFIEIHGAHGYLISSFLSPLSNTRTDSYGGQPLENRLRFPLRVIKRVREAWPNKPLFVRISGTEWAAGPEKDESGTWKSWGIQQSVILAGELKKLGVDLLHMSSGGNWAQQQIALGPGYQVHLADEVKKAYPDFTVGTVGAITGGAQAESYLQEGKADVIFVARELLRDPAFVLRSAQELGVGVSAPKQYERAWLPIVIPKKD